MKSKNQTVRKSDPYMYRISFLSSGSGSLTETILRAIEKGAFKRIIPVSIISDRDSSSLKLGSSFNLKTHVVNFNKSTSREQSSNEILSIFRKEKIDFSFMTFDRILSGEIIKEYENKIINIHPSLLPAFPGYNTIEKAREYGCKYIGATSHFIDEKMDNGPIINQVVLPLDSREKLEKTEKKLYHLRQRLALEAIYAFTNDLIEVNNREVIIKKATYDNYPLNPCIDIPEINDFLKSYDK